jgi:homoserine/homoserine lactone efflux protein
LLFKSFQIGGIVYLLYLFVIQWRKKTVAISAADGTEAEIKKSGLYTKGALVALSNPKTVLLFTIVFPQFATRGDGYYWQILILGITFLALQFSSGCFYALLGARIKGVIQHPGYQVLINRLSAVVLLIVAVFLMLRI